MQTYLHCRDFCATFKFGLVFCQVVNYYYNIIICSRPTQRHQLHLHYYQHVYNNDNNIMSTSNDGQHTTPYFLWTSPLTNDRQLEAYYKVAMGYLCPDCRLIVASWLSFKESHYNCSAFTISKKTMASSINGVFDQRQSNTMQEGSGRFNNMTV